MKRRKFVKSSLAVSPIVLNPYIPNLNKPKRLKILVLGGTNFVDPAIVSAAVDKGHEVVLFNRGKTNPNLFPDLKLVKGDRSIGSESYESLQSTRWDVVIDVWPEYSNLVDGSTKSLSNCAGHYLFISSIAVYNNFQTVGLHESSPVVDLSIPQADWSYSEEKLAAETLVKERFPGRYSILRAGPITGWRDPAFDLYYWSSKIVNNDRLIAPGSGKDPIQFVDVKDVGRFAIKAVEGGLFGTYNCTGPSYETLTWKTFLESIKSSLGSNATLCWASEEFLSGHQVRSFSDLPLWAPLSEDEGFMQISNRKMSQTGFKFSSHTDTVKDRLRWAEEIGHDPIKFGTDEVRIGLHKTREQSLLQQLDC